MDFESQTGGDIQVKQALKKLPAGMRNKALRPGMRSGGEVIKKAAAQNIRSIVSDEATGLLAKSLVIRSLKMKNKVMRVAILIGKRVSKEGVRVGLYGSVLELGKSDQPPRPWLRPAARDNSSQAISALVSEARKRLIQAVEDAKR